MAGNTFGKILRLTTFGESHGVALGGVLDGCPAGLPLDVTDIQKELDLRKPGSGVTATKRKESDIIHLLSGLLDGITTGTPIGFYIANEDHHSADYGNLAEIFRPGHADWSYHCKYNGIRDYRGGGRSSGRETACRVAAGAIAKKILEKSCGATVLGGCVAFAGLETPEDKIDLDGAPGRHFFAASDVMVPIWEQAVADARKAGDTLGGIVRIVAKNVPAGLGEPVFDRLDATLAHAIMSVGAVKGIEIGSGFGSSRMRGTQNNDPLFPGNDSSTGHMAAPIFGSNHAGGILGGISSGQDIIINAAVKPIASIPTNQSTIDKNGQPATIRIGGRHDLSAIPRIVPVLSAMTALALADALLLQMRMSAFS